MEPRAAEAAYLEDYNEDAQTTLPETRQTANVRAKRSKPEVGLIKVARDEFSDSGTSSHTAATLGSTNSSLESKTGSNPLKVDTGAVASKRRPIAQSRKSQSRRQSPEKPSLRRAGSTSQKGEVSQPKQCNCTESVAKSQRSTAPVQNHHTRNAKAQPKSVPPPQPVGPPPAQMVQDVPILPQPRPRPSASQTYNRARPTSYHGGAIPQLIYAQQPVLVERPSPRYPVASPFPPPSYPPVQTSYFPPQQPVPPPQEYFISPLSPYETPRRPQPQRWPSENPPARPQSMFYATSPIIEYEQPVYPIIAPPSRPVSRQPSHRERPVSMAREHHARDEDFSKMAPPPPPRINTTSGHEMRPTVKHAHTTSEAYQALHGRRIGREDNTAAQGKNRSPEKPSYREHERSRRPSLARPVKASDEKVPNTHALERGMARMTIESNAAKQRRRASFYGHETLHDLEGSIEEYQASKGTSSSNKPVPIEALVRTKKTPTSSSDSSSRHSGKSGKSVKSGKSKASREGSDVKSRQPSSDAKSRQENDGLAMRIDASKGINLNIKGGYEGRTINLRQSKDEGSMALNIGSRGRALGSQPVRPGGEEKSRRRYSCVDGQGVTELERSRPTSRAPKEIVEEEEPWVVRERVITRSRRSSRSGYSGRGQAE